MNNFEPINNHTRINTIEGNDSGLIKLTQELSASLVNVMSEKLLKELAQGSVTDLSLEGLPICNADLEILISYCPNLIFLSLKSTQITDLSCLQKCLHLKGLDLSFCQKLNPENYHELDRIPNLTHIDITGCYGFTAEAAKGLTNCHSLKFCDLSICTNFTDEGIQYLPEQIEYISLLGLPNLSENVFESLAKFVNLLSLDFSQTNFKFDKLGSLASLKNLQRLYLWQCRLLRDENLSWIQGRVMQRVDVSYCTQLTDRCLEYFTKVEELSIDGCIYLTEIAQSKKSTKEISIFDANLFAGFKQF